MSEPPDFDFEHWARLAREDPDGFEALRARALDEFIADAPPDLQRRLRGLQWQVDQVRARSGTPLAACIRMSRMMWDLVLGEDGLIDAVQSLGRAEEAAARPRRRRAPATVLAFKTKDRDPDS